MKNLSRILVPTDFSEPAMGAFQFALTYADKAKASIELLHVVIPESEALDIPIISARATQDKVKVARKLVDLFAEQGIERVAGNLSSQPVIVPHVEIGFAANIISHVAKRDEIPLIIMSTKGEHSSFEKLFGSVTTGVIKHAPCDVLIIPGNVGSGKISSIAYATNLKEEDPEHIARIGKLFSPFKPTIHCVHLNPAHDVKEGDKEMYIREKTRQLMPESKVFFHDLLGDDLVGSLNDFVEDNHIDLLIMYKPLRSFLEKLMHRSNTISMAFYSSAPLMVIKEQ